MCTPLFYMWPAMTQNQFCIHISILSPERSVRTEFPQTHSAKGAVLAHQM